MFVRVLVVLTVNLTMLFGCHSNKTVLIADPRVLAIPVLENNDPIVDLSSQSIIAFGPSPEIPNNTDYTKIRKTVYDKLVNAQAELPKHIRFCLYEGYRSLSLQQKLFDNRYHILHKHYPQWSHQELFIQTTVLVSPVVNLDGSRNIPPHSTGGAIDVYLIDDSGHAIDMGVHPADWIQDKDGSISRTDSTKISKNAQKNRQIMAQALEKMGFVNYPTEYWHWSYGDRYWAYQTHQHQALYNNLP